MTVEATAIHDALPLGPRDALHACALALGISRGPVLLLSSKPRWEHELRDRIGDRLFTLADPARPHAQAWVGAVWIEPQRKTWHAELSQIARELPGGALLSIVLSLPLTLFQPDRCRAALGVSPAGIWQLRAALVRSGFRVERTFGFHTLWWTAIHWLSRQLRSRRPDLSDRLRVVMQPRFTTPNLFLPLAMTGLIQARAGMRP